MEGPLPALRLLCADARLAPRITEQVLRLGVASRVVSVEDPAEMVDAVVSICASPDDVLSALGTLRPGGVVYCEVDRARREAAGWGPDRLSRRLRAAGLTTAGYWRRRRGPYDVILLPLDVPGAVPWYLEELMDDRGLRRALIRRALRVLVRRDGRRLGAVARHYCLVGVLGSPGQPAAAGATPALLAAPGTTETLLPVVLARGQGEWSRVVLLPFGAGDRRPREALKLPRTAGHNAATEREQQVLAEIAARMPPDLAATVPTPAGIRTWSGLRVGTETFLPGRPVAFAGTDSTAHLEGVTDWLVKVHLATRVGELDPRDPALLDLFDANLGRVAALASPAAFDVERACATFGAGPVAGSVPLVWQHGDLTSLNVRWDGRRHTVVDWEAARTGPALCDLFYLTLHWSWPGLPSFDRAPEEVFASLFLRESGQAARAVSRLVPRYCTALGVDRSLVAPLLMSMLTRQALDRADRVGSDGGAPGKDHNVYADLVRLLSASGGALCIEVVGR